MTNENNKPSALSKETPSPKGEGRGGASIAILNLMPIKETTEEDFLRVLSPSPLDLEIVWMRLRSHVPKHTSAEHMDALYTYFDELRSQTFDGLIITGAPVEHLAFEEVTYWKELTEIFEWAKTNVKNTLYICWAAQAGLYYHFGVEKHPIPMKMFGIFPQHLTKEGEGVALFRGFDDEFMMPHSRHTEVRADEIRAKEGLQLLVESDVSGASIAMSNAGREFFITGHMEYNPLTLDTEYRRDFGKRNDVAPPVNYYRDDDPQRGVRVSWRAHANLLYQNWINHYLAG